MFIYYSLYLNKDLRLHGFNTFLTLAGLGKLDTNLNYLKDLIDTFSSLPEVYGILLGGSRSTKLFDKLSDYDVYIYINKEIPLEKRKIICEKIFEYYELNNTFWETEDNGILKKNKYSVDIIYRKISWLDEYLNKLLFEYKVNIGYTTCIW